MSACAFSKSAQKPFVFEVIEKPFLRSLQKQLNELMTRMNPIQPILQSATPSLSSSKIRISTHQAVTGDGFPPRNGGPSKLTAVGSNPQDPHIFLVPPHENPPQPELRAESVNGPSPNLTFGEGNVHQTVGEMFSDPIFEGDPIEKSALVTEGTAPFTQGHVNNLADLAFVPIEPSDFSTDGGAGAGVSPKGVSSTETPPFAMTAVGPASLLGGVTLGMATQVGSILVSSFLIGLGVAAGSACYRIVSVWLQKRLVRGKELHELSSLEDLIRTGTTAPSTIKADSLSLHKLPTTIMGLNMTKAMESKEQQAETEQADSPDAL